MRERDPDGPVLEKEQYEFVSNAVSDLFKDVTQHTLDEFEKPRSLPETVDGDKSIEQSLLRGFLDKFREFTLEQIKLTIELLQAIILDWDPSWKWFLQAIITALQGELKVRSQSEPASE